MPRRKLNKDGSLPDFAWLYKFPGSFRRSPSRYPRRCGWCEESYWILLNQFRVCPKCDLGEDVWKK